MDRGTPWARQQEQVRNYEMRMQCHVYNSAPAKPTRQSAACARLCAQGAISYEITRIRAPFELGLKLVGSVNGNSRREVALRNVTPFQMVAATI